MQHSIVFKRELILGTSKFLQRIIIVLHVLIIAAIISAAMMPIEKIMWVAIMIVHGIYSMSSFVKDYPIIIRVSEDDWHMYEHNEWKNLENSRFVFQSKLFSAIQCSLKGKRRTIPIFFDAISPEDYHYMAYVLNQKNN